MKTPFFHASGRDSAIETRREAGGWAGTRRLPLLFLVCGEARVRGGVSVPWSAKRNVRQLENLGFGKQPVGLLRAGKNFLDQLVSGLQAAFFKPENHI